MTDGNGTTLAEAFGQCVTYKALAYILVPAFSAVIGTVFGFGTFLWHVHEDKPHKGAATSKEIELVEKDVTELDERINRIEARNENRLDRIEDKIDRLLEKN